MAAVLRKGPAAANSKMLAFLRLLGGGEMIQIKKSGDWTESEKNPMNNWKNALRFFLRRIVSMNRGFQRFYLQ